MKRYPLFAIITLIFFSCSKENSNEFVTDPGNPYNDTTWVKTIAANSPVNEIFQILSSPSEDSSFDATNGKKLWTHNDGQGHNGGIITYLAKGKQYVAVMTGWGSLVGDGYGDWYGEPWKSMPKDSGVLKVFALQ